MATCLCLQIFTYSYIDYDILQVYFPAFLGSSVYLRFLNELVLNKDDETAQAGSTIEDSETSTKAAVLKISPIIMGKDLDDPDSLWERPALLYVHLNALWLHAYGQG